MLHVSDYIIRKCSIGDVDALCARHHGYGGAGTAAVYAFGIYEHDRIVAAYAWQPPPPASAQSVCKTCPHGVLSLSRMVAVPHEERRLNHVSRPLRHQMKRLIDRTRWPVLVTYSDEGQGHTGHVYKCSGWTPTIRSVVPFHLNADGVRASRYRNGTTNLDGLTKGGMTTIQRWEHWICDDPATWMEQHDWRRVVVHGKRWRSGTQAHTYVKIDRDQGILPLDP